MTINELLESLNARLDSMDARLERIEARLSEAPRTVRKPRNPRPWAYDRPLPTPDVLHAWLIRRPNSSASTREIYRYFRCPPPALKQLLSALDRKGVAIMLQLADRKPGARGRGSLLVVARPLPCSSVAIENSGTKNGQLNQ